MRLCDYGGRMISADGIATVEMRDPNDNARRRFQYRRRTDGGLERRVLMADGQPSHDGSPWEPYTDGDLHALRSQRGRWHPILDPLGL
jgi:hypothetical protein